MPTLPPLTAYLKEFLENAEEGKTYLFGGPQGLIPDACVAISYVRYVSTGKFDTIRMELTDEGRTELDGLRSLIRQKGDAP